MRILLSAYACEPGKGSEPGTGWQLAMALARHCEVTVLTRSNNRETIEKALLGESGPHPDFIYHDLPSLFRILKKRRILPTQAYYALWQRSSCRTLESATDIGRFDIFHHLTFNSFEIPPGVPAGFQGRLVRGPLGGGQTAPACLLGTMSFAGRIMERLRSMRVRWSARAPAVRSKLAACDLVFYANRETRDLLHGNPEKNDPLMIDVGVDPSKFTPSDQPKDGTTMFSASNFEPRKGTRLLLMAFQQAHQKNPRLRLRLAGCGRDVARERSWVSANGLGEAVRFLGRCDHQQMAVELASADVFIFPSLRDTSGAIVLEAMSCGLPVICLDHQGARCMVGESCGLRIPPQPLDATVEEMARAMLQLAGDAKLRKSMGHNARERVLENFSWEKKSERLVHAFRHLTVTHG
jgi:glycosyltransferase involved in cell wall biosynthesis